MGRQPCGVITVRTQYRNTLTEVDAGLTLWSERLANARTMEEMREAFGHLDALLEQRFELRPVKVD